MSYALQTGVVQRERIGVLRYTLQSADVTFLEGIELSALEDDMVVRPRSGHGKRSFRGEQNAGAAKDVMKPGAAPRVSGGQSDRGEVGADFGPVILALLLHAHIRKRDLHQTVLDGRLSADGDGLWLRAWRNDDR